MPTLDVIQRIYEVLGEDAVLLPLTAGTKKCVHKSWPKIKLEETKVDAYVSKLVTSNIGVSLGVPSNGLCSIDFDDDAAAAEFFDKNPGLASSLRTRGARGCNVWVKVDGEYPSPSRLFSQTANRPVGEWRSTGNYTAIYGKHPSGCNYTWLVDAPVAKVKFSDILWPTGITLNEPTKTSDREPGKPLSQTMLETRRKIAEAMLDDVIWDTDTQGFCTCPGKHKHTQKDGLKDCRVFVDGVPTVHCLHQSCQPEVVRTNATLRQSSINSEIILIPDGYVTVEDSSEKLYEILRTTKRYYSRGRSVCEVSEGETGPCLEPVSVVRARATWEKHTRFGWRSFKDGETQIKLTCLTEDAAKLFLAADERHVLPRVDGVVTCPILYQDALGQLLIHNEGYNPHTKIFVSNPNKVPTPNVPLAEAVDAIKELVSEFIFEGPSHRSRGIMSLITPALVFSGLLGGRPPVDVAEADESQAGKGYRQKMIHTLYGEQPSTVAQKVGGVGGLDESFQEALIRGRPFIIVDNLRGKLNSTYMEAFLTAPSMIGARGFGRAEVEVNVARFITFMSSNNLNFTEDMANRSSIVRIRKHLEGYTYKQYGPNNKDIVSYISDNQPYYLGCVYRVVQEWYRQGCQMLPSAGHDFHWWAGRGEWIMQKIFNEAPMLDGHRSLQKRAGDGRLGWLQQVAYQVDKAGRLGDWLKMHDLVNFCGESGIESYRKPGDYQKNFPEEAAELRYLGNVFGPLFKRQSDSVGLDGFTVRRGQMETKRDDGKGNFVVRSYRFMKTGVDYPDLPMEARREPVPSVAPAPGISFLSLANSEG